MRALDQISHELRESGLDYQIKNGGKHLKFLVEGRVIGILPTGGRSKENEAHRRGTLNTITRIRRIKRERDGL